jgi:hypothetical protein
VKSLWDFIFYAAEARADLTVSQASTRRCAVLDGSIVGGADRDESSMNAERCRLAVLYSARRPASGGREPPGGIHSPISLVPASPASLATARRTWAPSPHASSPSSPFASRESSAFSGTINELRVPRPSPPTGSNSPGQGPGKGRAAERRSPSAPKLPPAPGERQCRSRGKCDFIGQLAYRWWPCRRAARCVPLGPSVERTWDNAGGPDEETNGLALCSLHHKAFDLGAFTIHPGHVMLVSQHARGQRGFDEWLLRFHGQPIRRPKRTSYLPAKTFLDWHEREVFKRPPRELRRQSAC